MAKRHLMSKRASDRNSRAVQASALPDDCTDACDCIDDESDSESVFNRLEETIEDQRHVMFQAQCVLRTLEVSMREEQAEDPDYYANVVEAAESLVSQANERLDLVNLWPMIDELRVAGDTDSNSLDVARGFTGKKARAKRAQKRQIARSRRKLQT